MAGLPVAVKGVIGPAAATGVAPTASVVVAGMCARAAMIEAGAGVKVSTAGVFVCPVTWRRTSRAPRRAMTTTMRPRAT
jgi:hypothetical protein